MLDSASFMLVWNFPSKQFSTANKFISFPNMSILCRPLCRFVSYIKISLMLKDLPFQKCSDSLLVKKAQQSARFLSEKHNSSSRKGHELQAHQWTTSFLSHIPKLCLYHFYFLSQYGVVCGNMSEVFLAPQKFYFTHLKFIKSVDEFQHHNFKDLIAYENSLKDGWRIFRGGQKREWYFIVHSMAICK